VLINAATLQGLFTAFKTIFQGTFNQTPVLWEKVAMLVPSSTAQEIYAWLGSTTGFREWLGDRLIQNLATHDFTIKNRSFENTIGIDRDKIEDDQIGVFNPVVAQLGMDAKKHPDLLVFALLQAGFNTACYDKQYFFDTDHPVTVNGITTSYSNFQGGVGAAWYLLDTSRAVKPLIFQKRKDYNFVALDKETDANVFNRKQYQYGVDCRVNAGYGLYQLAYASKQDLTADNYEAARAAMASQKKHSGEPLGVVPNLLVVPPSLEGKARRLLKNEFAANGATNEWFGTAEPLMVPELAA
jgi:phage major head subunit gpT-like protein